jgi:uncharacterized membrane protein
VTELTARFVVRLTEQERTYLDEIMKRTKQVSINQTVRYLILQNVLQTEKRREYDRKRRQNK